MGKKKDKQPDPDLGSAIMNAARQAFAAKGYANTTMKSVAGLAGVAPTVVKSLYDNKAELFAAAMRLPFDPSTAIPGLIGPGLDGLGERLVRFMMTMMSDDDVRDELTDIAQSGQQITAAANASALAEFLQTTVIDAAVASVGIPDARLRTSMILSELAGLAAVRYVVKVEPLSSMSEDEVVALYAPRVQQLLDPRRPL